MIIILSPAKTLDYDSSIPYKFESKAPFFMQEAEILVEVLRRKSLSDIASLMSLSDKLAALNVERFQGWSHLQGDHALLRACIYAYKGDVYEGLRIEDFSEEDLYFADKKIRILSGLYGLLRPLDQIYPYRLEMSTALATNKGQHLYDFWGEKIVEKLNADFAQSESKETVLLNLASNEYFSAINYPSLKAQVIQPVFKDYKNGQYKVISFFAKKARGLMATYIVKNRIQNVDEVKEFNSAGYCFNHALSDQAQWVFTRKSAE